MRKRHIGTLAALGAATLLLPGCGALDGVFGSSRGKQAPDEFQVVAEQPLAIPPNADLRPPRPGAPRPQDTSPTDAARGIVSGRPVGPGQNGQAQMASAASPAESALLQRAGAGQADPNIRSRVNEESRILADQDRSLIDSLIFWRDPPKPGVLVDPTKEQQRIREAQAVGTPVTQGDTPTIERRRRGLLEGIF